MFVRAAQAIHARWERLPPPERERLRAAATRVKGLALDLRGRLDPEPARRDLAEASRVLASGLMDTAAADPHVSNADLEALRDELADELRRLAERDTAERRRAA